VKRGARHLLDLLPLERELRVVAIESRVEVVLEHLGIAEEDEVDVFRGPGVGSEAKLDSDSPLRTNLGISSSPTRSKAPSKTMTETHRLTRSGATPVNSA
jgi:hypothetical protein